MKKTTSKSLSQKLAKYGALSLAMTGLLDAYGQKIKTDIPDFVGGIGDEYLLDLNNDAIDDFRIYHNGSYSLFLEPLKNNNEALGIPSYSFPIYGLPYALSTSDPISATPFKGSWLNLGFTAGRLSLNYGSQSSSCSVGYFCNVDRYLGLRFDISGAIHYGWARLDVNGPGDVWIVKSYGYNNAQGESILAGEGAVLGLEDSSFSSLKIVTHNKAITLHNLQKITDYKVYTMTGKIALNGKTDSSNTYRIEANTLANGIYVIELADISTGAVIRKKIIL